MNDRRPGRPTESLKDSLLKVRVNADTLESLDKTAKKINQTRSDIIRGILPIVSSKDFEDMISLSSLQSLEQYSLHCKKYFSIPDKKMRVSDVSTNFPAFVSVITSSSPTLFIKYPTYKIRVLHPKYNAIEEIIKPILQDVEGISYAYESQCVLFQGNQKPEVTFLPELMCLKITLEENTQLKEYITMLLNQNNIRSEVWPAYYLIGQPIKIESENGIDYLVTIDNKM